MDRRPDGWMVGWIEGQMDGWMDRRLDGWMDGWIEGQMDGWIDGWKAERKPTHSLLPALPCLSA